MSSKWLQALTLAVAAFLSACSPIKVLNALTPSSTFTKTSSIAYGPDPRQQLDIYRPVTGLPNAPVVVFFYGGSWNSGSKDDYGFVGEALASRGIVVVIADYRLYPQVRYPAFLQDGAQAVAWTHQHIAKYGADPRQLYLMGHSSGAYNASMLALDARWLNEVKLSPSMLKGWIGLAGPYDFLPIENREVRPVFFFPDSPPDSQPINHVSHDAPPSLLIASVSDTLVNPTRNTGGLAKKLLEAGVPVETFYFTRTSHATLVASIAKPLRWLAPVLDQVTAFIRSTAGQ
ncbi:alpha/beta hydrolase [Pseudomonas salomonii]|uniref:Alpha/beta hydrolase fold domain-containing protein n=1 Tax=Pseudomonas salomonii TaxID=191391 RepID=A0ABS9GL35_9PSED|nr:alpha/beta hydrolase [Pseudomonas salomonii]MCF5546418.1 alpha/beta hydrolase fold domain-containing protein [Pseudomonas salomonii]